MTLAGQPPEGLILFRENGLTFECDPIHGQKTGFFLDQRENRARVEKLSKGKSVLNVFAYTGGFSVYAARGGAKQVISVDISAPALQAAIRNFSHNQHIPTVKSAIHETIAEDAFEVLARMESQKRLFDLVIIDPPMFAQNQKSDRRWVSRLSKADPPWAWCSAPRRNFGAGILFQPHRRRDFFRHHSSISQRVSPPIDRDRAHRSCARPSNWI